MTNQSNGNTKTPLQPAPTDVEQTPPAAPLNYDVDVLIETPEGFHFLFRGNALTPRNALTWMKTSSAELAKQGFKPVRRDVVFAAPAGGTAAAAPSASAGGAAVWIKGDATRPPKCSIHGNGKFLEGTTKSGPRQGQPYAFWACQTRDCKPAGEPV